MIPQKVCMWRKSKAAVRLAVGEGGSQVGAVDGSDSHDLDCMNCMNCVDCSLDLESWAAEAANTSAVLSNLTVPTQRIVLAKVRAEALEEAAGLYHEMRSQLADVEEAEVKTSCYFDGVVWKATGAEAPEYTAPLCPWRDQRLASSLAGNYSGVSVALHPIEKQGGCYLEHSFGLLCWLSV